MVKSVLIVLRISSRKSTFNISGVSNFELKSQVINDSEYSISLQDVYNGIQSLKSNFATGQILEKRLTELIKKFCLQSY